MYVRARTVQAQWGFPGFSLAPGEVRAELELGHKPARQLYSDWTHREIGGLQDWSPTRSTTPLPFIWHRCRRSLECRL